MSRKQKAAGPKPQKNKRTQEKAGLTFSEKKRLAQLKRTLAGNGREEARPDTAQKTITFKKMYRDGVCQVADGYYTKMVEFFDINYDLLEIDDQGEILEQYSRLINYFDPSIRFELFLFNRQVNEQTLMEQFDIPLQGDEFDDIREEYTEMLKKQAAKGNNGIIKSKYLIFGIECKDYREARAKLGSIEADVVKNFLALGTHASCLDGKGRLRILHEYFNQDTMEPFRFSFKELSESGKSVKDYIAPPGFDFRYPSRFKAGKMYGSVHYLDIIAPRFNDELLKKLLDIDDNLTITLHMQTMDPVKAIKMLKGALTNIQKMKVEEQKKAVRSGYDMDILPTDIITYEKDTLELLDDLNTSNQKIIKMTFLITCYGRSKRALENITQRVSGIIQQANCNLRCLQYLQEQGLMASAPIGCNDTGIERVLTTKSTAILVPFCTQELFMPAPAIYYGLNALSNNMIMADRKRLRTPNGVILGTPGSGKSFSAKREILSCFLTTGDDIIICDPEGEYFPLVQALRGQVVKLATNSRDFLNPMDIQPSHKGDREALKLKSDFLITLCDLIARGKDGLENDEKGIIDTCIKHIYDGYFEEPEPENMPILEDLYNALLKYEPKDVAPEMQKEAKRKAVRIANSLVLYVHGSQNYFNHRTNVDSHNRIMCFDIRDLGNQLKELGMLIVQDAVWNRVSQNRERKVATRYYCDEFHLLLKERQTAVYSVEIWKRFRKWGGIPTGLTQNVGDFLKSEEIEGILGNSDFVYLLNQNAKDHFLAWDEIEDLGYRFYEAGYIDRFKPNGKALYGDGMVPEPKIHDMARRMQGGGDIRGELAKALMGNHDREIHAGGNAAAAVFGDAAVTVAFGNAKKQFSYEEMGAAFLKLIENEYKVNFVHLDIDQARAAEEREEETAGNAAYVHGVQKQESDKGQSEPEHPETLPEESNPENAAETPELDDMEDGDEIIDLGDEAEQVLADMKKSLEGRQDAYGHDVNYSATQNNLKREQSEPEENPETELAFRIADRYISIQETDGGYDYSIMGADYKVIDGGVYDNPEASIYEALDDIVSDLKENPFAVAARGSISGRDELIPVDYDSLMEKAEEAERGRQEADKAAILASEIDRLSYDYNAVQYSDTVEDRDAQIANIADDIRNGNTEYLSGFLNAVISDGIREGITDVFGKGAGIDDSGGVQTARRAKELLDRLAEHNPPAKAEGNAIHGVDEGSNSRADNALNDEKGRQTGRISVREKLAEKKALIRQRDNAGKNVPEKEAGKKSGREM